MLILFEAGGLYPRMAYVLDGEPASTSPPVRGSYSPTSAEYSASVTGSIQVA